MKKITDYRRDKTLGGSLSALWAKWERGWAGTIQGHRHLWSQQFLCTCVFYTLGFLHNTLHNTLVPLCFLHELDLEIICSKGTLKTKSESLYFSDSTCIA